jgi:hypothetical protein
MQTMQVRWMTGGLLQVMCLHYQEGLFVRDSHYNP